MRFEWSPEKNAILKEERNLSFEMIVAQIEWGHLWKIEDRFNKEVYHDLLGVKRRAAELGLPYQSLVSSLIHQFVEGELTQKHGG